MLIVKAIIADIPYNYACYSSTSHCESMDMPIKAGLIISSCSQSSFPLKAGSKPAQYN